MRSPEGRVERGQRLVQEQQARPRRERPGQGHALPLAAGEGRGMAIQQAADLERVDRVSRRARVVAHAEAHVGAATVRCGNSPASCGT